MSKTIRVQKDGFVLIKDFEGLIDIDKIKFYNLTVNPDKTITVKFYDFKKKLVRPYEQK